MKRPLPGERKVDRAAAEVNSMQQPASLRPESLLNAYCVDYGDARVIIDDFWNPSTSWAPRKHENEHHKKTFEERTPVLIRYVESLDVD